MVKNKRNIFFCLILIIVLSISSILLYEDIDTYKPVKIEDISTMELFYSPIRTDPLQFDLNKIEHRDAVEKILNNLHSGQMLNYPKASYFPHRYPVELDIILKNGTSIYITSVVDCTRKETPEAIEYISHEVEDQVSIGGDYLRKPVRMYSPELNKFMVSGWKTVFNFTLF